MQLFLLLWLSSERFPFTGNKNCRRTKKIPFEKWEFFSFSVRCSVKGGNILRDRRKFHTNRRHTYATNKCHIRFLVCTSTNIPTYMPMPKRRNPTILQTIQSIPNTLVRFHSQFATWPNQKKKNNRNNMHCDNRLFFPFVLSIVYVQLSLEICYKMK